MHWLELDRLQAQSVSVVSRLFQHYLDREQVEEVRVYGWRLFQLLSDQPTSQFQHAKVLQQWLASEPSKRIDVLGVLIANEPDEELHWIALRESAIAGNDRSIYLRALSHIAQRANSRPEDWLDLCKARFEYEGVEESVKAFAEAWVRFEGNESIYRAYKECLVGMEDYAGLVHLKRSFLPSLSAAGQVQLYLELAELQRVHFSIGEALETVCDGIQSTSHFERFVTFIEESVSTPDHAHQVFTRIAPLREPWRSGEPWMHTKCC